MLVRQNLSYFLQPDLDQRVRAFELYQTRRRNARFDKKSKMKRKKIRKKRVGGFCSLRFLGLYSSYFVSTGLVAFLLRMYTAAAKITMMAKIAAGAVHPELVAGGPAVEFVAVGVVIAVVALAATG